MLKDGTTDGPRVTKPGGVVSLMPKSSRPGKIPSPVALAKQFQDVLPKLTDNDRSAIQSLLGIIKNGRYLAMHWESEGNRVTIHRTSQDMPLVHFPAMYKQCSTALNELRTEADNKDLAEKTKGRSNGQRNLGE